MAKYCPNCNAQLEDDSVLCNSCGANVEVQEESASTVNPEPEKKLDKKILALGGAVLAGIIVVIIALLLIFPGPKTVAKKYVKGMVNGNAKQIVNCMPSFMFEDKDDKKEMIEDLEELLDDGWSDEFDKVKFKVKDVSKLSDNEISALKILLKTYEAMYDDLDEDDINLSKAKKVEIEITLKEDGETKEETFEIVMIKYKGQWRVLTNDFGFGW